MPVRTSGSHSDKTERGGSGGLCNDPDCDNAGAIDSIQCSETLEQPPGRTSPGHKIAWAFKDVGTSSTERASVNNTSVTGGKDTSTDEKNKRHWHQSEDGDYESGHGRQKRHKSKSRVDEPGRLACPFYKHDPSRYRRCHSLVLKRNSIVKQHLFRAHRRPSFCHICMTVIHDELALREHTRAQQCQKRDYVPPDGITPEQERKLRSRGVQTQTEEEQWFEMFSILFPDTRKPSSAYLSDDLSEDVESLNEFMRRQGADIFNQEVNRQWDVDAVSKLSGIEDWGAYFQTAFAAAFDVWQVQRKANSTEAGSQDKDAGSHDKDVGKEHRASSVKNEKHPAVSTDPDPELLDTEKGYLRHNGVNANVYHTSPSTASLIAAENDLRTFKGC